MPPIFALTNLNCQAEDALLGARAETTRQLQSLAAIEQVVAGRLNNPKDRCALLLYYFTGER